MSNTIHGSSHQVIKFMRKNSAALAVYWIYISRTNAENVAYPALRKLAVDTGWSINLCKDARDWLVEHKALEEVSDYVRPSWRTLEENEKKKKLNLDKAEYYRPTGNIEIDGKSYSLLYFGNRELSDIEQDDSAMYQTVRHRKPYDIVQNDTELGSINSLLGTNQEELLRNSSAAGKPTRKTTEKNTSTISAETLTAMKDRIALKFYGGNDNVTKTEWKRINKVAHELCMVNRTPDDVDVIYDYCDENFDNFTVNALTAHASTALRDNPNAAAPVVPTQNFNGKEMNYSVLLNRFRIDVTAKEDAGVYKDRLVSPDLWEWLSEAGYTQDEIKQIKESK